MIAWRVTDYISAQSTMYIYIVSPYNSKLRPGQEGGLLTFGGQYNHFVFMPELRDHFSVPDGLKVFFCLMDFLDYLPTSPEWTTIET